MGKMIVATCSVCGDVFRSRTRPNSIRKIGKHWRKEHPEALSRRIKAGKRSDLDNPSVQDFVTALGNAPATAMRIYGEFSEHQYQHMKVMLDALEPILPKEYVVAWNLIEALHDKG